MPTRRAESRVRGQSGRRLKGGFALVLFKVGKICLGDMGAGREVGLGESACLACRTDFLSKCRGALDGGHALAFFGEPAFLGQQGVPFSENLVLIFRDELAQPACLDGLVGRQLAPGAEPLLSWMASDWASFFDVVGGYRLGRVGVDFLKDDDDESSCRRCAKYKRQARGSSQEMSAPDLARNRRVGDLRIVRQQECLAEDD